MVTPPAAAAQYGQRGFVQRVPAGLPGRGGRGERREEDRPSRVLDEQRLTGLQLVERGNAPAERTRGREDERAPAAPGSPPRPAAHPPPARGRHTAAGTPAQPRGRAPAAP